ncbi:PAS domain S-box protein [Sulfurimonas lithotrophica]|uniref:histidine kinase n=1 Tax=Sulfurimonas lithotrophica TaxID=2590022 RepID=A0A5P8NZ69_9BACT|nr:PAS domain-containing sensor histidine kinase [Sulfurimonas lithotrophica]QFR48728.1 PAS domain S-box protein [Sulfurimonas lithotrophica]
MLQQFKDAIESSNIISKTDTNGIITFVNDEFCKISGYTKDELIGQNHNIVRHPDVDKNNFKELWNTIKNKKIYKSTVKNLAKDGSVFYVNTTIIPILDDNDDIFEYIAIRYDVTKEMFYKEELEKNEVKQKILFAQARHASLGQMLANIAHQWRQPLTELSLTVFNLKKNALSKDEEALQKYYEESKNIINSMSKTIEDFSNFFTPNREVEQFDIKLSVDEALELMDNSLKSSMVDVEFRIQNDLEVLGVANELTQVVLNLLKNSIDAFELNGVLIRQIDITIRRLKDSAEIEFRDNAGGIKKDIVDRIFEPYFTSKHQKNGTGLGLFMSKMIVEQSFDGSLDVKSKKHYTIFSIKIPTA